ncbi:Lrp/AsnC family transcriptional regulator [Candidatus Micrarchaeota archaeon]|nr:Lrp/AsnC family transcriptional regulator [Candidatus Micrarchaeota archaeon]
MDIDGIDKRILSLLRENSRIKNVEIARQIGLTEGAVRNRIEKMTKTSVIQRFTINTSAGNFFGVVLLKARGDTKKMMREVSSLGLLQEAFEVSGEFDGCIVIEAPSLEELDKKIDKIRKCMHVADTRTFISVKKWI